MVAVFQKGAGATAGEVLAFLQAAAQEGADAAVPAVCVPVLAGPGGCRPNGRGAYAGCYVFPSRRGGVRRAAGWERAVAWLLLAACAPLLVGVGVAVWLCDGWPVLFLQERYGQGGRPFTLYKFRTMVRRSEQLQGRLQRRSGRRGRLFKLENDPRVTRLGARLRRTFLDELPQLFNVALGDMRLVGPRPLPAEESWHYTRPCHGLRLDGRPGMTGLWQVSGRNARTFEEMCLLDAYYLANASWALDARILLRTLGLLFGQAGLAREAQGRG